MLFKPDYMDDISCVFGRCLSHVVALHFVGGQIFFTHIGIHSDLWWIRYYSHWWHQRSINLKPTLEFVLMMSKISLTQNRWHQVSNKIEESLLNKSPARESTAILWCTMQTNASEKKEPLISFDALRSFLRNIDAFTVLAISEANIDIPTISKPAKNEIWRNEDILRIPAC